MNRMDELYFYGFGLIGLFIILFYWYLNSVSIESRLIKLKEKNKHTFKPQESRVLSEDDLASFPRLMQGYLKKIGAVGKEIPYNFSLSFTGKFRIDQQKPFMPIKATQFNYLPEPTRLFTMKLYMFKIITMVGEHEHHQGKGFFGGKLLRYITLFNVHGEEIDIGDLTTFFNDCLLISPAGLVYLQDKLEWRELNESMLSVKLTYKNLNVEADFLELMETVADFYRRLDMEKNDVDIQKIMDRREKIDAFEKIEKDDQDILDFESILNRPLVV